MKNEEVSLDFILFNVGKQLYSTQREITTWKNKWLKNGVVSVSGQNKIELELIDKKGTKKGLKDFNYDLSLYPFLYYREILNFKNGVLSSNIVITVVKDLKQIRELMLKELLDVNKSIFKAILLHYCELLPYKIIVNNKEGYIETYSLATCNIVDKLEENLNVSVEFDIYEIEIDGKMDYSYTLLKSNY